jgi:uncharacterized membrane protein
MEGGSILLFLHLLGGASWLGASIFANVVLVPYVVRRPPAERPELVQRLIRAPERLVIGSALLAGVTGLLLGISSGRIRGVDDAATPFGILWVASIVVAIAVFATGGLVTSRAAAQLTAGPTAHEDGERERGGEAALCRLRVGFGVELAGIITILALMVALGRS